MGRIVPVGTVIPPLVFRAETKWAERVLVTPLGPGKTPDQRERECLHEPAYHVHAYEQARQGPAPAEAGGAIPPPAGPAVRQWPGRAAAADRRRILHLPRHRDRLRPGRPRLLGQQG